MASNSSPRLFPSIKSPDPSSFSLSDSSHEEDKPPIPEDRCEPAPERPARGLQNSIEDEQQELAETEHGPDSRKPGTSLGLNHESGPSPSPGTNLDHEPGSSPSPGTRAGVDHKSSPSPRPGTRAGPDHESSPSPTSSHAESEYSTDNMEAGEGGGGIGDGASGKGYYMASIQSKSRDGVRGRKKTGETVTENSLQKNDSSKSKH